MFKLTKKELSDTRQLLKLVLFGPIKHNHLILGNMNNKGEGSLTLLDPFLTHILNLQGFPNPYLTKPNLK